jgi:hypothetical protein
LQALSIDYRQWLNEIIKSNGKYESLFAGGKEKPPIFFFGNPEGAIVATIGINPSATEFEPTRGWTAQYFKQNPLLLRCSNYFDSPLGIQPHEWFDVWKTFLTTVGCSYVQTPRAVHLDFSPRATFSMGALQKQSKEAERLFLDLILADLKYLVEQIRAYTSIKYLYLAGSVTKRYYAIDLLKREASRLGIELEEVVPFQSAGPGSYGLYNLDVGDNRTRRLFFCSTSPSSRTNIRPHPLITRAKWLKSKYPEFIPKPTATGSKNIV